MGKYAKYETSSRSTRERPWKIHPIWRGIGCFLIILIPLMSYAGAQLFVQANREAHWLPMPFELTRAVEIPGIGLSVPYLYANLLAGFVLMILGYALLTILFSIFYSVIGPPRYGPTDSPPLRTKLRNRR